MPTYRFPVLVWQDFAGRYTARVVDDSDEFSGDGLAGIGPTAGAAVEQVEEYLAWRYAESPWLAPPDFHDPQLATFKVSVRPEYSAEKRIYPCEQPVPLQVHCVHGRQEGGLLIAALPL